MVKNFLKLLTLLALMFISQQVLALRCGNKLVDVGDNKAKVVALCGEPDFAELRDIRYPAHCIDRDYDNGYYYPRNYRYNYQRNRHGYVICQYRRVEVWTYNFGPRKFMRELIFRRGVVKEINTLSYGY